MVNHNYLQVNEKKNLELYILFFEEQCRSQRKQNEIKITHLNENPLSVA
jgi:hypothetical protein